MTCKTTMPLRDEHARTLILQRVDAELTTPPHVAARARILAGAIGRHADGWATLDQFGAWCVRSEEHSMLLDAEVCEGLSREDKRTLRRLLSLTELLADVNAYSALLLMHGDGTASRRHWPRAHQKTFGDRLYQQGGHIEEFRGDRFVPALYPVPGGRS